MLRICVVDLNLCSALPHTLLCIDCSTGLMQDVHVKVLHCKTHTGLVCIHNVRHTHQGCTSSSSPILQPKFCRPTSRKRWTACFGRATTGAPAPSTSCSCGARPTAVNNIVCVFSSLSAVVNQQSACTSCCCARLLILACIMDGTCERAVVLCCWRKGCAAVLLPINCSPAISGRQS